MAVTKNKARQDKSPVARFYDSLAPLYTRLRDFGHGRDGNSKELLIAALAPFENDSILDIGTGPGVYALDIAKRAGDSHVIGIDISEAFIKIASDRAAEAKIANIKFAPGNIEALEFADGAFTKIICAGVFSVIKKREEAVKELARVLQPGGRLAVREPRRSETGLGSLFGALPEKSRLRRAGSRMGLMFGHFSPDFMTDAEIKALFAAGGFSRLDFEHLGRDILVTAIK